VVSVGALVLGISQSANWGWSSVAVWILLLVSAAVGSIVVARSRRVANPILDLTLFEYRTFRWANVASLVFGIGFFSMFLGYVLFLDDVWGKSTRDAGLLLTPIPALGAVVSPLAGRFSDRHGERLPMMAGGAIFAIGGLWFAATAGDDVQVLSVWLPGAVLLGLGAAIAWPAIFGSVMVGIPSDRYAAATGINQTVQRISAAVGVAIAVTLLDASGVTGADLYRRLFLLTALCGLLGVGVGTRLRTIARPAPAPALTHSDIGI
jgi:MFS family permease